VNPVPGVGAGALGPLASGRATLARIVWRCSVRIVSPQLESPAVHITARREGRCGDPMVTVTELLSTRSGVSWARPRAPHPSASTSAGRSTANRFPMRSRRATACRRVGSEREIGLDPSYFESGSHRLSVGSPDVALDVCGRRGRRGRHVGGTNVSDGQVAVFTNVSVDHSSPTSARPPRRSRRKAGIVKDDRRWCWAIPMPISSPSSTTRRGRVFHVTLSSVCVPTGRVRRPDVELFTPTRRTRCVRSVHGAHQATTPAVRSRLRAGFRRRPLDPDGGSRAFARFARPAARSVGRQPPRSCAAARRSATMSPVMSAGARALAEELRAGVADLFVVGFLPSAGEGSVTFCACGPPSVSTMSSTGLRAAAESRAP